MPSPARQNNTFSQPCKKIFTTKKEFKPCPIHWNHLLNQEIFVLFMRSAHPPDSDACTVSSLLHSSPDLTNVAVKGVTMAYSAPPARLWRLRPAAFWPGALPPGGPITEGAPLRTGPLATGAILKGLCSGPSFPPGALLPAAVASDG